MNNITPTFKKLLSKFRFDTPVPDEVRKFIMQNKSGLLIKTIKAAGDYNIYYGFVLRTFLAARKIGLSLTVGQSAAAVWAVSIVLAVTSAGAIYLAAATQAEETVPAQAVVTSETATETAEPATVPEVKAEKKKKADMETVKYRIGVNALETENVDEKTSRAMTKRIFDTLVSMKGAKHVEMTGPGQKKSVNYMLMGNISRMGSRHTVTAKLVNVKDGKVIALVSENAASENELKKACARAARKIGEALE